MYEHDYSEDTSTTFSEDDIPYSLIYISCLFLLIIIMILLYHYYIKRKANRIINSSIAKRGTILKYDQGTEVSPEVCTICYIEYQKGEQLFSFNCHHHFHLSCIKKLFESCINAPCPYCNQSIVIQSREV